MTEKQFIESLKPQGYCLASKQDENTLREINAQCPVLVRCGCGRVTIPVQSLPWFVDMVNRTDNYIRDVSIPVSHLNHLGIDRGI